MEIFKKLMGLKIIGLKGIQFKKDKRVKAPKIELRFILFDDKKTYLELEEQDYYSYHDCSSSAREIHIHQDPILWSRMMGGTEASEADKEWWVDATESWMF